MIFKYSTANTKGRNSNTPSSTSRLVQISIIIIDSALTYTVICIGVVISTNTKAVSIPIGVSTDPLGTQLFTF